MMFSEKLIQLRRERGLSQEQLADQLGVTRQSVSKWESGAAMPELVKLVSLSEMFDVTLDYLVKDAVEERGSSQQEPSGPDTARLERKLDDLSRSYRSSFGPVFSYTSRLRLFGLPLLCVRFGRERNPTPRTTAVGIVAVGNFALGVVSLGLISAGLFSPGDDFLRPFGPGCGGRGRRSPGGDGCGRVRRRRVRLCPEDRRGRGGRLRGHGGGQGGQCCPHAAVGQRADEGRGGGLSPWPIMGDCGGRLCGF